MVISLSAMGLTTGEVQAHPAEVYGAEVSRQTISTITDSVPAGMAEPAARSGGLPDPVRRRRRWRDPPGHPGTVTRSHRDPYRRAAVGMMGYGGQIGFGDPARGVDIGFTRGHLSHTSPLGGLLWKRPTPV